jgi:hypothetical protein
MHPQFRLSKKRKQQLPSQTLKTASHNDLQISFEMKDWLRDSLTDDEDRGILSDKVARLGLGSSIRVRVRFWAYFLGISYSIIITMIINSRSNHHSKPMPNSNPNRNLNPNQVQFYNHLMLYRLIVQVQLSHPPSLQVSVSVSVRVKAGLFLPRF